MSISGPVYRDDNMLFAISICVGRRGRWNIYSLRFLCIYFFTGIMDLHVACTLPHFCIQSSVDQARRVSTFYRLMTRRPDHKTNISWYYIYQWPPGTIEDVLIIFHNDWTYNRNIDGLVQDCRISSANALEILQSCTKPSIWTCILQCRFITLTSKWPRWRLKSTAAWLFA